MGGGGGGGALDSFMQVQSHVGLSCSHHNAALGMVLGA